MGIDLAGTHVSRKLVPVNWVSSGFLRTCYMLPLQNWQNMKPKKVVESFGEALQEVVAGFRTVFHQTLDLRKVLMTLEKHMF